jgi:hypothetical protein
VGISAGFAFNTRHRTGITRLVLVAMTVALTSMSCSSAPTTSPQASTSEPRIHCGDAFSESQCQAITESALGVLGQEAYITSDVWVRGFTLCGSQNHLFDMTALDCPVPPPPLGGGYWRAGVEVAFAQNALHGGVNVAEIGGRYAATLIGYRVPDPGWCDWVGDCFASAS